MIGVYFINPKNTVIIGARSIVCQNVTIGTNSIIGANSVVTKDIPDNCVAAGVPAKVIMSVEEYKNRLEEDMSNTIVYEQEFTKWGGITSQKKEKMKLQLEGKSGFIV